MKKFILSAGVALVFFFYVAFQRGFFKGDTNEHPVITAPSQENSQTPVTQPDVSPTLTKGQVGAPTASVGAAPPPPSPSSPVSIKPAPVPSPVPIPQPAPEPTPPPAPIPVPQPAPQPTGQYKDGSYTGPVTDAFFGPYQVKAVISDGKLSDIVFLQYPNDRPTSTQINTEAMPILKSEAIKAQSANVDVVSGATQSSAAFKESLASALVQAKN